MMLIILIYLVILGIRDYRERCVPLVWLAIGGLLLPGIGIYRCVQGEVSVTDLLLGILPGVLLLLVAWSSGKAGYADGVVLIELGLCLGYRESIILFCFSLLLLSAFSIILLILRRIRRDTKVPYFPFMAITFLLQQL